MLFNKTSNYSYTSIFITICLELITIPTEFLQKKFSFGFVPTNIKRTESFIRSIIVSWKLSECSFNRFGSNGD